MKQFLSLIILYYSFNQAWAVELKPYIEFESFSHSEPIAINAIMNGWDAPFQNGEVALSVNRAEVGIGVNNWQVSVLQRQDYLFEFDVSTARLFYDTNNKNDLFAGDEYSLNLSSKSFIARGLKLGYQHTVSDINIGISVSYLEGLELTDGNIMGRAMAVSETDYDFNFDVDYFYTNDGLFHREVDEKPIGYGYGIDLSMNGYLLPGWFASLQVNDLFAQINWLDAPRTVAIGSSSNKEYDSDGYAVFRPVASGIESNEDYSQTIPTKVFLKSVYQLSERHLLLAEYSDYSVKSFIAAGYRFSMESQSIDFLYNLSAEAWNARYQTQWFSLDILADQLPADKARTLGLTLALNVSF
ncbi:MAG TPA: hypothetical protein ENK73_05645 [Thiomicrospira sp.]|nr:hypothetical protein [Thiomicrospira sp.]